MSKKNPQRIDPLSLALPLGGVDSHAHLDGPEFDSDREAVLARARQVGLTAVCNVFLGPEDLLDRRHLFDGYPEIFFILGIHPCDGQKCTPRALTAMRAAFEQEPRLRAVGEIGLDFYWKDCPKEIQFQAFTDQLDMARELDLPVVIHCREAAVECLMTLEAQGFTGYPLLWHCYGGGPDLARRIVANGWHISIPGPVSYPANVGLREAVAEIPLERLLLETDAPYLAPVPWRGKRNEPAFTVFTARWVAEARRMSPDELWLACGDNARRFFALTG